MTEKPPPAPEQVVTPAPTHRGLERPEDVQSEERSVTDRTVFDTIREKYKDEPKEAPLIKDPSEDEPQPKGQVAPTEKPETTADKPSEPRADVEAAKQFLKLKTRVPQSALDAATEDEILAWAEERRERESKVDSAFARAKRAEKETEAGTASDKATDKGEPAKPTPDPDLKVATKALAEELALTDDGRARLDEVLDKLIAPLQSKLTALEQSTKDQESRAQMSLVDSVRQQVGERFPGLSDDATFEKVLADAAALENSPNYAGSGRPPKDYLPDLFAAVARGRGLQESAPRDAEAERVAAESEADRQERLAAAPGPVTSRPTEPIEKSKGEQDWDVFQRIRGRKAGVG